MGTTRRRFLQQMSWLTAATAAHGAHIMQPAAPPPSLLDTRALAHFVDPLPIPAVAKPTGLRPSPSKPCLSGPLLPRRDAAVSGQSAPRCAADKLLGATTHPVPAQPSRRAAASPFWSNGQTHCRTSIFYPSTHSLHGAEADKPEVRTVVHLHGGRTGPESDGYPEDWFVPGKSATCYLPESAGSNRPLLPRSCDGHHPPERSHRPDGDVPDSG